MENRLDKIEKILDILAINQLKTDEQISSLEKAQLKTDAQISRLEKAQLKTQSTLDGLGFNIGMATEHVFINGISKTLKFGGVIYDSISSRVLHQSKDGTQREWDIVMYNGNSIAIIEIKHNVKKEDIDKLKDVLCVDFKKTFPIYAHYRYYLGVAGAVITNDVQEYAKMQGVGIWLENTDVASVSDISLKAY